MSWHLSMRIDDKEVVTYQQRSLWSSAVSRSSHVPDASLRIFSVAPVSSLVNLS